MNDTLLRHRQGHRRPSSNSRRRNQTRRRADVKYSGGAPPRAASAAVDTLEKVVWRGSSSIHAISGTITKGGNSAWSRVSVSAWQCCLHTAARLAATSASKSWQGATACARACSRPSAARKEDASPDPPSVTGKLMVAATTLCANTNATRPRRAVRRRRALVNGFMQ